MARAQQPISAKKATGGNGGQLLAARAVPGASEIAVRAYELWLQSGRTHGKDQEHWYQAERELRAGKATL